ncbi:MAG: hypothetical protein GY856_03075 [bacterium]|nr:hypothetical protein [bacterium]
MPVMVALTVGMLAWPFTGWPLGLIAGLAAWTGSSLLLRRLRRCPQRRRAWRLVLLVWMIAATIFGIVEGRLEPPSAVSPPQLVAWERPGPFQAGVAEVEFQLPESAVLAGWGGPPRRLAAPGFAGLGVLGRLSLRLMGPPEQGSPPRVPMFRVSEEYVPALGARALVLLAEHDPSAAPVALVRLDLIEGSAELSEAVLVGVEDLGFVAATLLVAATHTHSGPGGFLRAPLAQVVGTDHLDQPVVDAIVAAAITAVRRATAAARPARIALVASRDRGSDGHPILARRRGRADPDDIDDQVWGLRLEDRDSRQVLALLVDYAVHTPRFWYLSTKPIPRGCGSGPDGWRSCSGRVRRY